MIENSTLIYEFVNGYLKLAVECSICKESYEWKDDVKLLERFNKNFLQLKKQINEYDIDLNTLRNILDKLSETELQLFVNFLKNSLFEQMISNELHLMEGSEDTCSVVKNCTDKVNEFFFGEDFNKLIEEKKPRALVEFIRCKEEEYMYIKNN